MFGNLYSAIIMTPTQYYNGYLKSLDVKHVLDHLSSKMWMIEQSKHYWKATASK